MAEAQPASAAGGGARYVGDFRFDRTTRRLWRNGDTVLLRPKAAEVLALLIDRAGEVIAKQDLLDTVWPSGYVGDAVLSVCINELRHAFDDDAHDARFIATVHRRGYRLVADVSSAPPERGRPAPLLVGRRRELAVLHRWWKDALDGQRQTGFVVAEAGTGKTALVDAFVDELRLDDPLPLVGRGQCVDLVGPGEPYLPALQAMANLWRGPRTAAVTEVLQRSAASWLLQLPELFTDTELAALRQRVGRASTPRMLREFAVAMEQVSALRPLLLVLEDLHDADRATVELLSFLARRREPARLLVLTTFRPADVIAREHPVHRVVQDLRARGLAGQLALELLSAGDVSAYLSARFAPRVPTPRLIAGVHERTEGHALFMVALCEHLLRARLLVEDPDAGGGVDTAERLTSLGVPSEVRLMLEQQIDALEEADRTMLEAASAAGMEFAADVVSSALADGPGEMAVVQVEEQCGRLARPGSLLRFLGAVEWPDGTAAARYRFTHQMYREILYERLGPARRAAVHRAIGTRLTAVHGARAAQVAGELALHFERGRDYPSALRWTVAAATTAAGRSAYPEAHAHAHRGLDLLDRMDDPAVRSQLELALRRSEVVSAAATWGWRRPEARDACLRLQQLADAQGDVPGLVAALLGLYNAALMEGDESSMRGCLNRIDGVVQESDDDAAALVADLLRIRADSRSGRYASMWDRAQRMLDTCERVDHADLTAIVGDEMEVAAHLYGGLALWQLGFADQARAHADAALDRAHSQGVPAGLARALWFAAVIQLLCGDAARVRRLAGQLVAVCSRHDLEIWRAGAAVLDGWAIGVLGDPETGLERLRQGAARWTGLAGIGESLHQRLAAELCLATGDVAGGLAATRSGLDAIGRTRTVQSEPELWRLRGELLRLDGAERAAEAEEALSRALELASTRQIRGLQLRAATSLARFRQARGQVRVARELLAGVYETFTEGHDTHDLVNARAVLDQLT
ncbi:ATP-binding protein [Leekyejoonella antrihumi]|uniref:OmpR/PhoB-type domain-containing protein n=1 Tax=Leekyejoonella antrihumi TaxID=1660198 RepID=A0A563E016_9MICO|nr:AAA family ATPase [Leekyejoonella antrihumi]TWP35735.1 hypothetical protein FGL98_13070 [Leekyejoonella antrihumi]